MQLLLLDKRYQYKNELNSIELVFNQINEVLSESDHCFSHLVVNDKEIFADFDVYMTDMINQIETIKVEVLTKLEFVNELLLSLEEYIKRALPEIEKLTDELYTSSTKETWESMELLFEGLQWINQLIQTIDQGEYSLKNWENYIIFASKLIDELRNLEESLAINDNIQIADIIKYEIEILLTNLLNTVIETIDNEGMRHNLL